VSPPIDDETVKTLVTDARWKTLVRAEEPLVSIVGWDRLLLRQPRVLVPIDVQALYVPEGSDETFVRLPFAMTTPDGSDPEPMPAPFDEGTKRPPGVHLHWAMPDSLLDGTLSERDRGTENRLSLPPLPDRWVVLRIAVPREASRAIVSGWVIEAGKTTVTPLADWPAPDRARPPTGKTIAPDVLTGTVGGSLSWSGGYDAVANRFAFHDPLVDLRELAPRGVIGDFATYLVCGWWFDPRLDPLDVARSKASLQARLDALRWRLTDDLEDRGAGVKKSAAKGKKQSATGLTSAVRYKALITESDPTTGSEVKPAAISAIGGLFAESASHFAIAVAHDPYASLLHGVIHGVPVTGGIVADQRPSSERANAAFGFQAEDIAAVFAATGLNLAEPDDRRDVERLVSGFTHDLLSGVATTNGLLAIEEGEHAAGFSSRPGEPGPTERVVSARPASDLPGTRAARSATFGTLSKKEVALMETELLWSSSRPAGVKSHTADKMRTVREKRDATKAPSSPPASRLVVRPTPRYFEPMEPMLAVSGGGRSARHRFDDKRSPDGRLQCRWPSQVPAEIAGLVRGADLFSGFPAGGLPPEVVRLVESAMILDPYIAPWRVEVAAQATGFDASAVKARMYAETALRFSKDARFTAGAASRSLGQKPSPYLEARVAAGLNRFSLIAGVDPDPVGVTAWSQPWVPMWLEWEVELDTTDRLEGWSLGPIDLEATDEEDPPSGVVRRIAGRSPLNSGVAASLGNAITEWLKAEDARGVDGEVSEAVQAELSDIAHAVQGIDILSASLDSLHDVLLGLPVGPYGVLQPRNGSGIARPVPVSIPQLLLAGRLRVRRARIVDAFGRTLALDPDRIAYPARNDLEAGGVTLRPRLLRPARWLFRLVDPADLSESSPEATIDQLEPSLMINPVAGFLLPDHIDEALEVFDSTGSPIGQLFHDPISGGVTWEIAPGREGPVDAGPLYGLPPAQQLLGHVSAALVVKDAETRAGLAGDPDKESALSALLRAIDTTLWSVDTYAVLGATHVAGLVGRPIAVVRATLRLDILDDLGELDLSDPAARAKREAAYAALADRAFCVRIGEISRDDDGVIGFFVDDDFSRFHVVDKVVRDSALDVGRGRGQLGLLGTTLQVPAVRPIEHPYVVAEDQLTVRPGQTVRLTLLQHPGGKCHLTSGILPRKSLQLSRDWIHDGLAAIAPSARVGPVLIDSEKVRLPLIASFGTEQLWTRRDSNFSWKNDPILAATQTALLPQMPAKVEEGYIRIAPVRGGGDT
jgi:hypothetical protein